MRRAARDDLHLTLFLRRQLLQHLDARRRRVARIDDRGRAGEGDVHVQAIRQPPDGAVVDHGQDARPGDEQEGEDRAAADALALLALVGRPVEPALPLDADQDSLRPRPEEQVRLPGQEGDGDAGRGGQADRLRVAQPAVGVDPVVQPQADPAGQAEGDQDADEPDEDARPRAGRPVGPEQPHAEHRQPDQGDDHDQAEQQVAAEFGQPQDVPPHVGQDGEDDPQADGDVGRSNEAHDRHAIEGTRPGGDRRILDSHGHWQFLLRRKTGKARLPCRAPLTPRPALLAGAGPRRRGFGRRAGAEGVEPPTGRFGDGCSTN